MKRKLFAKLRSLWTLFACLIVSGASLFALAGQSHAANLTQSYIRLNRMASGTDTTMRVVFTTVSAGATHLAINMNGADSTTWTGSSGTVATTQTAAGTSGCDASATALPGTLSASGSGSTITITGITALSATTTYCVDLTASNAVHTPSAGEYHPTITESSGATDSTTVAVRVVSNDQITTNAAVPPTFNFAISGCTSNTDNFQANLDTAHVITTGGCTVTVNTNAKNGWYAWASDSNSGLHSAAAGKTISWTSPGQSSPQTISNGAEGYLFAVTSDSAGSGGGALTVANAFGNGSGGVASACTSGSSTSCTGDGLNSTATVIISSDGTASSTTFNTQERATISPITPAATDYTDTFTLIGSGYF